LLCCVCVTATSTTTAVNHEANVVNQRASM
jgi:hypothetical protein